MYSVKLFPIVCIGLIATRPNHVVWGETVPLYAIGTYFELYCYHKSKTKDTLFQGQVILDSCCLVAVDLAV